MRMNILVQRARGCSQHAGRDTWQRLRLGMGYGPKGAVSAVLPSLPTLPQWRQHALLNPVNSYPR